MELPHWETKDDVAAALGLPLRTLTYWIYRLDPAKRYHVFNLQRRAGGVRTISAPIYPLKQVQRKLLEALKGGFSPTIYVYGYVDGRNIQSNADVHAKHRWVLRVDLKDFFPSINFGRVRGLLLGQPFNYPPGVATLLAKICTHDNQLPQGAPTSPLISNLICRGLDRKLAKLAHAERCRYSRYCDDLVFSTDLRSFPKALADVDRLNGEVLVGHQLLTVIADEGFKVNPTKTLLRSRAERQMVTGLVVNQFTNVPRQYVRHLQNLLYIWRKYGEGAAEAAFRLQDLRNRPAGDPKFRAAVRGQVQYVGAVKGWEHPVYVRLGAQLAALDEDFRPRVPPAPLAKPLQIKLFAEGKTDYTHISAALSQLQQEGRFLNLSFDFPAEELEGDRQLLRHAESLAVTEQSTTCVLVFDRDSESVVQRVQEAGSPKHWNNNVWTLALPYPDHRQEGSRICIESLYTDADLQRKTDDGLRVYLREEFDENGAHNTEPVVCSNPKHETLVPPLVIDGATKRNVALSKSKFAAMVAECKAPYDTLSSDGFVPLFEAIEWIVGRRPQM